MDMEYAKDIALIKYGIIAPVHGGFLDECSKEAYFRAAAEKTYRLPNGKEVQFKAGTIKKWYLAYEKGGIEALMPRGRSDAGKSRTLGEAVQKQILAYRKQFPKITGQKIYEKLLEDGFLKYGESSRDSVYRFLKAEGMSREGVPAEECLSFEFEHANDCWQADTVDGPYITPEGSRKAQQTYLISFIDDASRSHLHGEFFYADNSENVQKVLKTAIMKAGLPRKIFDDNGSPYKNHQIDWVCAKLGIVLVHSRPYKPRGKGKEERSHRTAQERFMDCTDFSVCHSLDDLNRRYWKYLEDDYHNKRHSGIGMSPRERYMQDYGLLTFLDQDKLDEAFLLHAHRRVNNVACIQLHNREYEVPQKYIGQTVHIRYPYGEPDVVYIYDEEAGERLDEGRPVKKTDNARRKRRPNSGQEGCGKEGGDV